MRDIEKHGGRPTAVQLDALRAYSGWGGCADAFSDKAEWADVNSELHEWMDEEQYLEARGSTLTAFYTPAPVVDAMWGALRDYGIGGPDAHILEPGCGTGNFLSTRPDGMQAHMWGVELDTTSAAIGRLLNPEARIVNADLADTLITGGSFDAAIGNVPYSGDISIDYTLTDGRTRPLALHDYFIERAVDGLRPGGIAMLLTSRHTLDKRSNEVRADLARKAELVGVARLPGDTFTLQAGTQAVTDVLVLRKREHTLDVTPDEPWLDTMALDVPGRDATVTVNRLIAEHPELVAGRMRPTIGRFGGDIEVDAADRPLDAALHDSLTSQLTAAGGIDAHPLGQRQGQPMATAKPAQATAFEYTVDPSGAVWYGDEHTVELVAAGDGEPARRLRAMIGLRDAARALQAVELDPASSEQTVEDARRNLNERYESFVAGFGRLSERANMRAWEHDEATWPLVSSLEERDTHGRFLRLSDMFTKRTLAPMPPLPEHVDSVTDAYNISMDRTGGIDTQLIGRLTGMDPADVAASLGDLAVIDPDTGNPLPADDYLSGDIGGKLEHIDTLLDHARHDNGRAMQQAWLEHEGIADPQPVEAARADTWRAEIGPVACDSLADPDGTGSYMNPAAALEKVKDWDLKIDCRPRLAVAVAVQLLDGMGEGRGRLTVEHTYPDGGQPAIAPIHHARGTDPVFDTLVRGGGFSTFRPALADSNLTAWDCAVLTHHVVHAEQVDRQDKRAIIAAFFDSVLKDYRQPYVDTPFGQAIRAIGPDGADTDTLVDLMVDEPAMSEYLMTTVTRPEAQHGFVPYQYDGMHHIDASRQGYERFKMRRAIYMDGWESEHVEDIEQAQQRAAELEALRVRVSQAMPLPLESSQINMALGAPWIPPRDVYDFMRDAFHADSIGLTASANARFQVDFIDLMGQWRVSYCPGKDIDLRASEQFGTPDRNPYQLLEAVLNNQQVRVTKDTEGPDGKTRKTVDQAATMAVMDKMNAIRDAWDQWLAKHPERVERLTATYNRRFNTIRPKSVDGSYLTTPGIAEGIQLRAHQKNAVARALRADEGTLIAHVVGAGKTFEGIALVHEAKRLGKASKPMLVVPNHLTGQWAADFMRLYPTSRILVMDKESAGNAQAVRRFWGRVAAGDWDAVIVPESRFGQLHVSRERRADNLQNRIQQYMRAIRDAKANQGDRSPTVKRLEGARKRIEATLTRLRGGKDARDDESMRGMEFEQLGVDMLFVDEAHHFKNLGVPVASSDLGMQVSSAAKCEDMLDKCELLREQGHGSNIVFATGTPVSNSMSELYNMQRYLAPASLKAQGVESFASWAGTFGQVVPTVELKPEGNGFQVKQRFAKFANLPELMASVKQFSDVITNDDIDLDLPELEMVPVAVPITDQQAQEMERLSERADRVRAGTVTPEEDNMLAITSDGRKIALDPKLLKDGEDREPLEGGKVQACADNIMDVWRRTEAEHGAQLVFCDTSTPAGGQWNIYADLKRRLVEAGMPGEQIAFVHDAGDNPAKREAMFEKVRDGEIRVLIGSTMKLGTGTNVQTHLAAVHDLDCPWRPADLEQRLGRILRQGNTYKTVQAYRYVAEGTLDAYSWQTVERKQRFISQVMSSKSPAREASDLDETVMDYAAIKAIATGDPTIQERMNLENDINQLKLLKSAWDRSRAETRWTLSQWLEPSVEHLERDRAALNADRPRLQQAADMHKRNMEMGRWEGIELDGRRYTDREQANAQIIQLASRTADGGSIGSYDGFDLVVRRTGSELHLALAGQGTHTVHAAMSKATAGQSGPVMQLDRLIRTRIDQHAHIDADLAEAQRKLDQARDILAQPWERQAELDAKISQLRRLEAHDGQTPERADTLRPDTVADHVDDHVVAATSPHAPDSPDAQTQQHHDTKPIRQGIELEAVTIVTSTGMQVNGWMVPGRINPATLPDDCHAYQLRGDIHTHMPLSIETDVKVNHMADLITRQDLTQDIADGNGMLCIDRARYSDDPPLTVDGDAISEDSPAPTLTPNATRPQEQHRQDEHHHTARL